MGGRRSGVAAWAASLLGRRSDLELPRVTRIPGFEDVDFSAMPLRPPASAGARSRFVQGLGDDIPAGLVQFFAGCDGGEGWLGEEANWVNIWSVHDILEHNRDYQVDRFAQGLVLFGSNGSGTAYGFDTLMAPISYVSVPFVRMHIHHVDDIAETFRGFLIELQRGWKPSI
jgi:hypothetical protein